MKKLIIKTVESIRKKYKLKNLRIKRLFNEEFNCQIYHFKFYSKTLATL